MGLDSAILCFVNRLNIVIVNYFSNETFYERRISITMILLFQSCTIVKTIIKPFSALPIQDQLQSHSQHYQCKTMGTKQFSTLPLYDQAQRNSHLYIILSYVYIK